VRRRGHSRRCRIACRSLFGAWFRGVKRERKRAALAPAAFIDLASVLVVLRPALEPERGGVLDNLTIALCISIGTGVPWLIAIYSDNGARQLIGNSVFGLVGTALAAFAFDWISPTYSIIALISAGPPGRASDNYCRSGG